MSISAHSDNQADNQAEQQAGNRANNPAANGAGHPTTDEHSSHVHNRVFSLSGPSLAFDPARTPLRGDLADIALAGKVFAPHYAVPMPMRVITATPLLGEMEQSAEHRAELTDGTGFAALDIVGGYIWGYATDGANAGLVGFVVKDALVKAPSA